MSEKDKGGRPAKAISDKQLKAICSFGASLEDCARFFECSEETIQKYIKDKYSIAFNVFRDEQLSNTKMSLIQSALMQAKNGNTALMIFCLKNIALWRDRTEISVTQPQKITLNYSLKNTPKEIETIDVTPENTNDKENED